MERRARTRGLAPAVQRSLTLLRVFLLASAVILLVGAGLLGSMLTHSLRTQAIDDRRQALEEYVNGVLRPYVVDRDRLVVGPAADRRLADEIRRNRNLITVKVWRPDGVLAWTNRGSDRIGKRFDVDGDLGETIRENRSAGEIGKLDSDEDAVEARLGFRHVLEVYAPVRSDDGTRALGAYEIYARPGALESNIASRKRVLWATVALVFLALYGALALLVRGASATLARQTHELRSRSRALMDSYRRLEESSLEAIEALNATVDAKDPYTAGHSQRVREIALAIGAELALEPQRLDALRYGALFHDIGKLRVPDAVLLKPARLTPDEFELIKRHAADGAEIVGRFGRLRETVPIIRHHHERWDGGGYPDGISGEAIPLEAAIVGLADAWDAMTTERPYHRALTQVEALEEIHRGHGTQFHPAVVEAFYSALKRDPRTFTPAQPLEQAAVSLAG